MASRPINVFTLRTLAEKVIIFSGEGFQPVKDLLLVNRLEETIAAQAPAQGLQKFFESEEMTTSANCFSGQLSRTR